MNNLFNLKVLLSNMKRIHLTVHGRVQGVFFRANIRKKALELNLKGYAQNLETGTVEIVAEGQENDLKALIDFCNGSPGISKVSKVDIKLEKPQNNFSTFEVK